MDGGSRRCHGERRGKPRVEGFGDSLGSFSPSTTSSRSWPSPCLWACERARRPPPVALCAMIALLAPILQAHPESLGCLTALRPGVSIMRTAAVATTTEASFVGKACGSTISSGESVRARFGSTGKKFVLEVSGGALFQGGSSKCGGVRVDSNAGTEFEVDTSNANITVSLVSASASGYGPVAIGRACTLQVVPSSGARLPPSPPHPPSSPPFPPTTPPPPPRETSSLFWVHAWVMVLAWLVLAPTGAMVARFGKRAEVQAAASAAQPSKPSVPVRKARWFLWHRRLQLSAVVLSAVGTAAVVGAKSVDGLPHLLSLHSHLGTTTLVCMLVQAAGGLVRPSHQHRHRQLWHVFHGVLGVCTWCLAIVTSILGALRLPAVETMYVLVETHDDGSLVAAVAMVAASSVIAFVVLEALTALARRRSAPS